MKRSANGRIGDRRGHPAVCARIVFPARVQIEEIISAPDDHFAGSPDCGVTISSRGRVDRARGCPTIRAGVVSSASVYLGDILISPPPYDHVAAGPNCRMQRSCTGGVCGIGSSPTIRNWIVSPARVQRVSVGVRVQKKSAPDDHLMPSPDCCVKRSRDRRIRDSGRNPTVCTRIVSAAAIDEVPASIVEVSPPQMIISLPVQTAV